MNETINTGESEASAAKRPRRWLRYSLRTFLVLVTLFCVWLAIIANRARVQKAAIAKLDQLGAKNRIYDYQLELTSKTYGVEWKKTSYHPLPEWLTNMIGEEYYREVWVLNFTEKNDPTDDELAVVDNFRELRQLTLYDRPRITDEGLKHFANLTKLNVLTLNGTHIHGTGLQYLDKLENLRSLSMSNSDIDDDGLKHVTCLKNLHTLMISKTKITDRGLECLKSLRKLDHLEITQGQITDEGLKQIAEIKSLKYFLGWENNKTTPAGHERLDQELKRRNGK